jgi:hypothetical protein
MVEFAPPLAADPHPELVETIYRKIAGWMNRLFGFLQYTYIGSLDKMKGHILPSQENADNIATPG